MRKRMHRNTTRLTARERVHAYGDHPGGVRLCMTTHGHSSACTVMTRALQAHARQALARERLRQAVTRG